MGTMSSIWRLLHGLNGKRPAGRTERQSRPTLFDQDDLNDEETIDAIVAAVERPVATLVTPYVTITTGTLPHVEIKPGTVAAALPLLPPRGHDQV